MEFQIDRDPFLKVLSRIQTVVERRNTMPVLGNALLQLDEGRLTVSATDLEVSLRTACEVEMKNPGALAVGAKKLYDIVRELPEGPIRVRQDGAERLLVTAGRSRFQLAGVPAEEFPQIPEAEGAFTLTVEGGLLAEMFSKTHFAMSQDETRYSLNGILLQVAPPEEGEGGVLRLVATDTHRLALVERPIPEVPEQTQEVILPRKAVNEARKLLEEEEAPVEIAMSGAYVRFARPGLTLTTKLVDGRFPNFTRVIPTKNDRLLSVERLSLVHAVRRMAVLSNEKSRGILFKITKDNMQITTTNPEQEEAEEELPVAYEDQPVTIGFNARYLQEIITAVDGETVRMALRNDEAPILLTDPDQDHFLYVLMPMRV